MSGPKVIGSWIEQRGGVPVTVELVDSGTTMPRVLALYFGLSAVSMAACSGLLWLVLRDWPIALYLGLVPAGMLTILGLQRYEQRLLTPYRLKRKLEDAGYSEQEAQSVLDTLGVDLGARRLELK